MKKILFLFILMFISIPLIKADSTFYLGDKVPNMYIEAINGNQKHSGAAPFLLTRSDGKLVYCINPFETMSTTDMYKSYTYNDPIFNLTNEELNKLNVIAYYGYGYQNHTDLKWYGITQFLMWENLNYTDVYFTDVYHGTKVEKYVEEVNELKNMVNNYFILPSFSNNKYEYDPNTNYILEDTNKVLNNYTVKNSNIDAYINNNSLYINTSKSGVYTIEFIKKSPVKNDYILYNLEGAQSLLLPGKIDDITFKVTIEVNSGSITINRFDSENKERLEATLEGSIYGIYEDNKLIDKLTINSNKEAFINNLPLGNYQIKELVSSKGYNKDNNIYDVSITKNNKDVILNVYAKVIEGNLIINKYYGSEGNYKLDESAIFEIYHNNKLIDTLSVKDGIIRQNFEYGTYIVKQVSGKKYYDFVSNFDVSIVEEKDYLYNFYTDKTDEIKAYEELLAKKEENLLKKEQELNDLQNKLEEEKQSLEELKNEINKNTHELDKKEEELNELLNNLEKDEDELNKVKEEIKKIEESLKEKEEMMIKKEEELNNLQNKLEEKENSLNNLRNELIEKEQELEKKQEHKVEEDVLVVEVPNTYKRSYNKLISLIVIGVGVIFIIFGTKKVTNH